MSLSSSRRSSRSTRASSSPAWRALSFSKSTAPSVSRVFAEPEQGSPLASAASRLPVSRKSSYSSLRDPDTPPKKRRIESILSENDIPVDRTVVDRPAEAMGKEVTSVTENGLALEDTPVASTSTLPEVAPNGNVTHGTSQSDLLPEPHQEMPDVPLANPPFQDHSNSLSVPSASTASTSPEKSSWFASFGRAKGKEKAAQISPHNDLKKAVEVSNPAAVEPIAFPSVESPDAEPEVETPKAEQPTPTADLTPTQEQPSLPVVETRSSSPPQAIPAPPTYKRSWFFTSSATSSATSSPSQSARPGASPTSPSPLSAASFPSSIDEDSVPQLPPYTEPQQPASAPPELVSTHSDSQGTVRARMDSLNPSTSRFTIRIPLLGRAKVPLEQAVPSDGGSASPEGTVAMACDSSKTATTPAAPDVTSVGVADQVPMKSDKEAAPTTTTTTTTTVEETKVVHVEESTTSTTSTQVQESSSSWWSYVGWSSTTTEGDVSNAQPEERADAAAEPTSTSTADAPSPASPTTAENVTTPRISDESTPTPVPAASDPPARASSIMSSESYSSSWLNPWAWYGSTRTLPVPDNTAEGGEKTESEMVMEEALKRDEPVAEPHPEPEPQAEAQEGHNPIESSFSSSSYRSGWSLLFSSRVLGAKRIEGVKRDENGVEVMDLDEGEEGVNADVAHAEAAAAAAKKNDTDPPAAAANPVPPTQPVSSPAPRNSSPSPSPQKKKTVAPPLTISADVKENVKQRKTSISLTNPETIKKKPKSGTSTPVPPPPRTPPPNLILPTWADTFHTAPRNTIPPPPPSSKLAKFVKGVLFSADDHKGKGKERDREFIEFGKSLPRAFDVLEARKKVAATVGEQTKRVVVIGVHGWFPGAVMRSMLGEPTGTSTKFVNMMVQALEEFQAGREGEVRFEKITGIPLEGEGTIQKRVEKLHSSLLANQEWINDLHAADAIFVATHSQGSVVSTHLLDRLIAEGHIQTARGPAAAAIPSSSSSDGIIGAVTSPARPPQRICCLALCGIHLGPLRYLSSSSLLQPYIQYFESTAARELFEFQNTESEVSKAYVKALKNVVDHGTKMVYVASLNDQVVPIYSGLFTAASHPLILRALYIDGDAYHSSDFLSNLLVLLLRVLNTGLSDSGLLAHLSEATAGSLNGVGHSTAYEELATYSLAVKYLFLTDDGLDKHPELVVEPFNALNEQNDYEIPWSLRDLIADPHVAHFFSQEIISLRDAFREWHPKTTILRDVKRKLQPIQKLPTSITSMSGVSKL